MESTTTTDTTRMRDQMRAMWQGVSPAWAKHADYVDRRHEQLTEHLLDAVALQPGDRVLELGCGAGGLGIAAAERLDGTGEVTLSDIAAGMVETAGGRAREHGLTNVRTAVLDIEAIDEPDGSYDVVLCRDGLQFAADPRQGAREVARMLEPGGRVAIATWASKGENPWLGTLMDAFAAETGRQVPQPGTPGPFALSDGERLAAMFADAGLPVAIDEVPAPMRVASFDEWWGRTTALAGPMRGLMAQMPEQVVAAIRARSEEIAARYAVVDGLELPGLALVVRAAR